MALEIVTLHDVMKDPEQHKILMTDLLRSLETTIGAEGEVMLQDVFLALRFSGYHLVKDDEIKPTLMR